MKTHRYVNLAIILGCLVSTASFADIHVKTTAPSAPNYITCNSDTYFTSRDGTKISGDLKVPQVKFSAISTNVSAVTYLCPNCFAGVTYKLVDKATNCVSSTGNKVANFAASLPTNSFITNGSGFTLTQRFVISNNYKKFKSFKPNHGRILAS